MGEIASCDELDVGLTSWHQDKQQTNYIDEGDGFLADSICQDGYIMNFFFRNFPHQSIMLTKDTPQHMLMCCSFLTCLRKKSHGWARQFVHEGIVSMGCLYWKNQVKIHGVVHKSGRGVPGCVLQETKKIKMKLHWCGEHSRLLFYKCPNVCMLTFYETRMCISSLHPALK